MWLKGQLLNESWWVSFGMDRRAELLMACRHGEGPDHCRRKRPGSKIGSGNFEACSAKRRRFDSGAAASLA